MIARHPVDSRRISGPGGTTLILSVPLTGQAGPGPLVAGEELEVELRFLDVVALVVPRVLDRLADLLEDR